MPSNPIMGVYGIFCRATDRWYVGASQDIIFRLKAHKRNLKHDINEVENPPPYDQRPEYWRTGDFGRDYHKYGRKFFSSHVLERVCDPTKLADAEERQMMRLKSLEYGYNKMRPGKHRAWQNGDL